MVKYFRYMTPKSADFRSNRLKAPDIRTGKYTKAQKAFTKWTIPWSVLEPRIAGLSQKTKDKYYRQYGTNSGAVATFKKKFDDLDSKKWTLKTMPYQLKKIGYWPRPYKRGGKKQWKSYSKKAFNSLIDYFKPRVTYGELNRGVNRLVLRRATIAAWKGWNPQPATANQRRRRIPARG